MQNNSINDSLRKLEKALISLEIAINDKSENNLIIIDATIQRFEYTIELFWKLLKKILLSLGREVTYPKEILKEAYAGKLINHENVWLQMLLDRNQTSHTYDEELAKKIYEHIKTSYYTVMKEEFEKLEIKYKS